MKIEANWVLNQLSTNLKSTAILVALAGLAVCGPSMTADTANAADSSGIEELNGESKQAKESEGVSDGNDIENRIVYENCEVKDYVDWFTDERQIMLSCIDTQSRPDKSSMIAILVVEIDENPILLLLFATDESPQVVKRKISLTFRFDKKPVQRHIFTYVKDPGVLMLPATSTFDIDQFLSDFAKSSRLVFRTENRELTGLVALDGSMLAVEELRKRIESQWGGESIEDASEGDIEIPSGWFDAYFDRKRL